MQGLTLSLSKSTCGDDLSIYLIIILFDYLTEIMCYQFVLVYAFLFRITIRSHVNSITCLKFNQLSRKISILRGKCMSLSLDSVYRKSYLTGYVCRSQNVPAMIIH